MRITIGGEPGDRWYPRESRSASGTRLEPGDIVIWDREPHHVIEIKERPDDLWGERYETRWAEESKWRHATTREAWEGRPLVYVLRHVDRPQAESLHLIGPARHMWDVLPEHYSVCRICRELPPCRHEITERTVAYQVKRTAELMAIPRGHCLSCGEYVTPRMQAARFPGPNLWRPDLGENSALFHARYSCSGDVEQYRRQWEVRNAKADEQLALDDRP
ncbi:hypothetical protein ACFRCG_41690 [Embleya sp. NPDC056575]|uniref:hypothetical protein n=1 Tax=unclassified Embleya TaxID=2699296 RepID=UPI0036ACCEDA